MDATFATTNVLLGVMAAASLLEILVFASIALAAWRIYTQAMVVVTQAQQQVEPVIARLNEVVARLDGAAADVKDITARAATGAARVDAAVGAALAVASLGAGGATASLARRALHLVGLARGARAAYKSFTTRGTRSRKEA